MRTLRTETVIVGSGPGGASVARALARDRRPVVLLERGRDWRGHVLYGTYPGALLYADRRALLFTREGMNIIRPLMVGGATSMYCGCAAPPAPWWADRYGIELDDDASEIARELEIRPLPPELRGEASTRVADAGRALGMQWVPQDKFMKPARAHPFDCGARCMLGCRCGAKWNAAEWVDDAVAAGATLVTRARADRVRIEGGRATGVLARTADGPLAVEAEHVVVAAGGIGSPVLLRRSGLAAAGRGITMDTTAMVYAHTAARGMGGDPPMTWSCADDDLGVLYSTLVDPWLMYPIILATKGPRYPLTWHRWGRTVGVMIKLKDERSGGIDDDGRISKGLTAADRARLRAAEEVAGRVLREAGGDPDTIFTTPLRGTHPSGSVPVGPLLTPELETEVDGLYVCDASVFPEALGRPTVLTILALGQRLARHLRHGATALLAAILLASAGGCAGDAGGDEAPAPVLDAPTFSAHVAPILYENCAGCHRPGGPGPFALIRYEDAHERADLIAAVTGARRMPPWLPDSTDYPFAHERRLSEREIAILARWAATGALAGDLSRAPSAPTWADGWALGVPDVVLEMAEPYPLPGDTAEVFRNFVLPVPLERTRWVRAVELQPGDARVVHHAVMAVDASGVSRQEDGRDAEPGFDGMFARGGARPPGGFFLGWTPGRVPVANPEGLAWPLAPGSDFVLQLHLRPRGEPTDVRARIGIHFADGPPARMPVLLRLGAQTLDIPAGQAAYVVTDSVRLPVGIDVLGLYPHAHYLATVMDVRAELPDGTVRQLLHVPDWDFNWQDAYNFAEPVELPAGTMLGLRYVYDNSAGNPQNPSDPPRRVVYGPASTDEMAELWIQALPGDPGDLAQLQASVDRKAVRDRVEGWRHLIALDPADAMAHVGLATYLEATGDADRAIDHYRSAIAAEPDYASAHYNLAILLERRGETASAIEHYRAAIRARPDHAGSHNNLGGLLARTGTLDEAERSFRRAVELEPERLDVRNNLGRLLIDAGKGEEALDVLRDALALRPDDAATQFNRALALASIGRTDEALRALDDGARRATAVATVEAQLALAWLLATDADAAVRRPQRALTLADQAARALRQPHPRVLDVQAAAYAAAGRADIAARMAAEAERLASAAGDRALAAEIAGRRAGYERGRPYVQPKR